MGATKTWAPAERNTLAVWSAAGFGRVTTTCQPSSDGGRGDNDSLKPLLGSLMR
jgi:hypothetical protein